jgi:hypothetical protein
MRNRKVTAICLAALIIITGSFSVSVKAAGIEIGKIIDQNAISIERIGITNQAIAGIESINIANRDDIQISDIRAISKDRIRINDIRDRIEIISGDNISIADIIA